MPIGDTSEILPDLTGEHYLRLLSDLHRVLRPRNYLEIGVFRGHTLQLASCPTIAVDPDFRIDEAEVFGRCLSRDVSLFCRMTSDAFFATGLLKRFLGPDKLDFAFLDGMHQCEYLLRDFLNTEKHCDTHSVICLHDCVPLDFAMIGRDGREDAPSLPLRSTMWTGDVWKTALLLRWRRPDLTIRVFNARDTGLVAITNLKPSGAGHQLDLSSCYEEMRGWELRNLGLRRLHYELRVEPVTSESLESWLMTLRPDQ